MDGYAHALTKILNQKIGLSREGDLKKKKKKKKCLLNLIGADLNDVWTILSLVSYQRILHILHTFTNSADFW